MVEDRRAHDPWAPPPRWETVRSATSPESSSPADTSVVDNTQADGLNDLEDMTKAELQDLAADKGLPTSGNKPDLIERLREAQ